MISAIKEYTIPALSKMSGVPEPEIRRALALGMLEYVEGAGGRAGKIRIVGGSFIAWRAGAVKRMEPGDPFKEIVRKWRSRGYKAEPNLASERRVVAVK